MLRVHVVLLHIILYSTVQYLLLVPSLKLQYLEAIVWLMTAHSINQHQLVFPRNSLEAAPVIGTLRFVARPHLQRQLHPLTWSRLVGSRPKCSRYDVTATRAQNRYTDPLTQSATAFPKWKTRQRCTNDPPLSFIINHRSLLHMPFFVSTLITIILMHKHKHTGQ